MDKETVLEMLEEEEFQDEEMTCWFDIKETKKEIKEKETELNALKNMLEFKISKYIGIMNKHDELYNVKDEDELV